MGEPPLPPLPLPDPGADERLAQDLAAVSDLVSAGVEVDGEVQLEASTWVVYGHSSYDGEVIVGVYHDEVEASEVVHLAPHPGAVPPPVEAPGPDLGPEPGLDLGAGPGLGLDGLDGLDP